MRLLLAIDDSPCSEAAIAALVEQFRPEGTEVRVIHVIDWPHDLPTSLAFGEGRPAAAHVLRAEADFRRCRGELLARAVDRLTRARFTATAHLVEGFPRQAIVSMADDWPADAIVIGSHGRHGLDRVLLGSVSEGVVRHARCSVHVVRPPCGPGGVGTHRTYLTASVKDEGVTP